MPHHASPITRTASVRRIVSVRNHLVRIPILFTLLLAACSPPGASVTQASQQEQVQATQAAFLVQTEIARGSLTPTASPAPSTTPTPPPPSPSPKQAGGEPPAGPTPTGGTAQPALQVTALPGLALYTHPEIPDYVFQIDPAVWEKDPSGKTADLVNTTSADCQINAVPGHGLGAPQRYFWQDLGRFRWEVMDYGTWAYVYPVLGAGLTNQGSSFLRLAGYNRSSCRAAQEEVLANLMLTGQAAGKLGFAPFQSPTPRPSLGDFTCPNTPPARLRVGDFVSVVTDGLWLRSAPRADDSTKERKFLRYAPYIIRVIGGPACEKYVYWQVSVSEFGEAARTTEGWIAEGDPAEYYLVAVK